MKLFMWLQNSDYVFTMDYDSTVDMTIEKWKKNWGHEGNLLKSYVPDGPLEWVSGVSCLLLDPGE